jgi:hypothetical protein
MLDKLIKNKNLSYQVFLLFLMNLARFALLLDIGILEDGHQRV